MRTIEFLTSFGLDALCERFAIKAKRHRAHSNLVALKYNQISSPMHEPIVQECRGLIVDEADRWRVVGRGYDKFFNLGEPNAAAVDWSTARVYEKLDGSLMTLYSYRDAWQVASSGLPDASGVAYESGMTFAELFRATFVQLGYRWPEASGVCYMFELMTPHNRVVVPHRASRLVLHGARDLTSMCELEPEPIASALGWECVKTHSLACADDCVEAAAALDPLAAEGFIVRDAGFHRVKVKSPRYVALAHLKDGMTGRRMLEIVRANESAEFLTYFPELRPAYDAVRGQYDALCAVVEADADRLRGISDQKAFAAEAIKTRCSSALFAMRAGKAASVREFFAGGTIQLLERALGADMPVVAVPASDG